jgi:D-arabinose 1-dehydrogenase-like Zn-dependent alcohol dehydrogenase
VVLPLKALVLSRFVRQRLLPLLATIGKKDIVVLKELIEAEKLTPVIDRTYPLSETPEAIRYLEAGHARGKVVITVEREHTGPPHSQVLWPLPHSASST